MTTDVQKHLHNNTDVSTILLSSFVLLNCSRMSINSCIRLCRYILYVGEYFRICFSTRQFCYFWRGNTREHLKKAICTHCRVTRRFYICNINCWALFCQWFTTCLYLPAPRARKIVLFSSLVHARTPENIKRRLAAGRIYIYTQINK